MLSVRRLLFVFPAVLALVPFAAQAQCPTANPSLQSPANNATNVSTTVTLSWSAVSNADSYDIYIGPTANGNCGVNGQLASSNTTTFTPPTLQDGTQYGWRVVAKRTACASTTSACGTFTTAAAACTLPGTFDLRAPNNLTVGATPQLSWNGASNASKYIVHIGTSNPPQPSANDPVVNGTSYTPTSPLSPGTYYWNVDAYASCNTSSPTRSTSTYTFTVRSCPTAAASITAPADGASIASSNPVTFNWIGTAAALSYDVMLSNDGGSTFTNAGNATSSSLTKSLPTGNYVWYVRTNYDAGCSSVNSQASRFSVTQTTCPNTPPTLTSPADKAANVTLPVTLSWTSVTGATGYRIFASQNGNATLLGSTTDSTRFSTSAVPTGTVTWWVVALFDSCPNVESSKFTFTAATTNCPTTAPILSSPANGASNVTNPVKFDWNDVSGATSYRVLVAIDGSASAPIGVTTDSELVTSVPGSSIEWWVEANFGTNCAAVASQHFKFTTTGCPDNPGTPTIIAPGDGANNLSSPVTLQWSAVAGAKNYVIIGSFNGGPSVALATTTATQITAPLPAGNYTWVVEAKFGDDCPGTISSRASFTVTAGKTCTSNTAPTLTSPANNATNVQPQITFDWTSVPGAFAYNVYAGASDTSLNLIGTTTDSNLSRLVPTGTTSWQVEALFIGCDSMKSAISHFTLAAMVDCDTLKVTRTAPADGATVASPVTFQWSAVANATVYRLWIANDDGAASIAARTTDTKATISVPSGNGSWYVEAVLPTCPAVLSSVGRFVVAKATSCDGHAAPSLTAPAGNITADKVTFQWGAAANAKAYRVWLSGNNQPFAEIATTTDTKIERTLPAAAYIWFVDAIYDNCPVVASARASFVLENTTPRCGNTAPALVSPADNATNLSSPVTFLWSSVPNAIEYRLYASIDNEKAKLIATTTETSLTEPVRPGTIAWYVEAVFRSCPATQSATQTFTVAKANNCHGDKPQLVSPADGSQNLTSPVLLAWNPVSTAIGYVIFARHGDGEPTVIGKTTDETTLSRTFPEGRIEWWVVAFVTGCDPAESKHFSFTVTLPNGCSSKKPVLLAPEAGDVLSPVRFAWTRVAGATSYNVWLKQGTAQPSVIASSSDPRAHAEVPAGPAYWFVEAKFTGCPSTFSAISNFNVLKSAPPCSTPEKPVTRVVGQVHSGTSFTVRWTPLANVGHYELQESTTAAFMNPTTYSSTDFAQSFKYDVTVATQYLYRVRGVSSCSDETGPWSDVVGVLIVPITVDAKNAKSSTEAGEQADIVQKVQLPGQPVTTTFTATVDKSWLTVTPASGQIGPDGITLTVTAAPGTLNLGTNTGTVTVTYGAAGKTGSDATTKTSVPVSVSVVTPVSPVPRNTPQQDSLIIPGISHANGANNSLFESDVRVANVSAQTMKYQLNFTPIATDGTQTGNSTTIEVEPGATTALDDILSSFFGSSISGGTLEIRPLTTSSTTSGFVSSTSGVSLPTVASSRTFNINPDGGTLGQYIPAIAYSNFIGKSSSAIANVLSLQQVAASSAYRTNIGLIEASGQAASVTLRVFDDSNTLLAEIPVNLLAGEYVQDNYFAKNGLGFDDGRVEIQVTSTNGRVTAYASTIDNKTNDPLLVQPVLKSSVSSTHYVLPGIAALNTGINNWRSDVRVYNAGTSDVSATLTYVPMPGDAAASNPPAPVNVALKAGEVAAFDDILKNKFGLGFNSGGALSISTSNPSSLITSARTYNLTSTGTLGQFIPGVTPADSVGNGERSLQILQLEQSDRYRTNIGVAETSGQPAVVEISLFLPDSKVTPIYTVSLDANQFVQFPLSVFNSGTVYDGRVSVKVTSGSGRVTAYGSVIDAQTGDPTYVPSL